MIFSITVGVILLTAAITTHALKRVPKARNWLYLAAGVILIAGFGQIGVGVARALAGGAARISSAWGIGVPMVLAMVGTVLVILMLHSLHPKKGKPKGWHGPLFFFAPAILGSLAGYFSEAGVGLLVGSITGGAVLLTTAVTTHILKRIPKARNWLYLAAGLVLIGGFGALGVGVARTIAGEAAVYTSPYGVGVAALLFAVGTVLVILMGHSLHPKKGKPKGWHGPLFFFTPAVLGSLGGYFTVIIANLSNAVHGVNALTGG